MFELSVKTHFSAAHRLVGYEGLCANPHGHNWEVEIFVRGSKLNDLGMLIDYGDIKAAIRHVMKEIDHVDLNLVPAFVRANPTSENLARYVHGQLSERINSEQARVCRVTICETPGTSASYWDEDECS
jgi:6-pyruvoyltetrahydropterin/6-carboxytetrahydropterin synthase